MRFHPFALKILVTAMVVVGCGQIKDAGKDEQDEEEPAKLIPGDRLPISQNEDNPVGIGDAALRDSVNVDLATVKALALTSAGAGLSLQEKPGGSKSLSIEAVSASGATETVLFTDNPASSRILRLYQTPKHLVFEPSRTVRYAGIDCYIVVLTLATGKLQCVPNVRLATWSGSRAAMEWDTTGDLISFLGYPSNNANFTGYSQLFRINMTGAASTLTTLYAEEGHAESFAVNGSGDTLFIASPMPNRILRVEKVGGGFQPMGEGEFIRCMTSGPQSDADSFFYANGEAGKVIRLVKSNGTFAPEDYAAADSNDLNFWSGCGPSFKTPTKVFLAPSVGGRNQDGTVTAGNYLIEMVNETKTPRRIEMSGVTGVHEITAVETVGDVAYLQVRDNLGNGGLVKFDIPTTTFTVVVPFGIYVISDISASSGGAVGFVGKRLSDGAFVAGSVIDGGVKIVSETLGDTQQLIQLN